MIDSSVQQIASAFAERWSPYLQVSSALKLDGTWPSVSVLDLITSQLRTRSDLSREELQTIRGAAAYLSLIVEKCWATFAESVTVKVGPVGIQIRAAGGEYIPEGEYLLCEIEQGLLQTLSNDSGVIEVIRGFSRPFMLETNIVSLFAVGVCTGFSPTVEGAWRDTSPTELQPCLLNVCKELARTTSENYGRLFPNESFGQVAELYLGGLIFPPMKMGESSPCVGAVDRVLNFFSEYKVKSQSIAQVVYNFAINPDELISCAGLIIFSAVASQTPPLPILARAQSLGRLTATLRPTMLSVRKRLGLPGDWVASGFCDNQTIQRFRIEESLGFIPWIYLSAERLKKAVERPIPELLIPLANLDLEAALAAVDSLLEEMPDDIELHLQRVKLELVKGDHEKANKLCRALVSQPESDVSPRFYNLWGLCQLQAQDNRSALRSFKAAAAIDDSDESFRADVFNNLGWAQLVSGAFEESLDSFNSAIELSSCPVTILLNKGYVLWQSKRMEELAALRAKLFEIAPTDRRVFATIVAAVEQPGN